MSDMPLVSFCLITYQQEKYIHEAVKSAFSQSYSPLEIVICDDASPDGTFDIIRQMVEAYRGPHRIIFHRNSRNRGLTGNVNAVMELAHGELIVLAAGDDISLPHRTQCIVEEWLHRGCPRGSLSTSFTIIDEDGNPLPEAGTRPHAPPTSLTAWVRNPFVLVNGAAHAFHADVFRVFGPLVENRMSEDNPLAVRALALGGIGFIDRPTMRYRRHRNNLAGFVEQKSSLTAALAIEAHRITLWRHVLEQVQYDLAHPAFAAAFGHGDICRARKAIRAEICRHGIMADWYRCGGARIPWSLVRRALVFAPLSSLGLRLLVRRILPGFYARLAARDDQRWQRR